ncbi:hypothetical protein [Glycomyces sp. YM15]|uniref:hypothetical protein n=1 Tax=Glycomyces sp. YM15 TaxID=2800446 RepID=UPI001963D859|nr:hypothetical protein [Glycomyces sp. YM15]
MARTPAAPRYTLTHYPHPLTGTKNGADIWGPDAGTWTITGIDPTTARYTAEFAACRCDGAKCRGWHAARIRKVAAKVDRRYTEARGPATVWAGQILPAVAKWTPAGPVWAHDAALPLPHPDRLNDTSIDGRIETVLWLTDPGTDPAQRDAVANVWRIDDVHAALDRAAADLLERKRKAAEALRYARTQVDPSAAEATAAENDLDSLRAELDRKYPQGTRPSKVDSDRRKAAARRFDVATSNASYCIRSVASRETELAEARERLAAFTVRRRENAARVLATAA